MAAAATADSGETTPSILGFGSAGGSTAAMFGECKTIFADLGANREEQIRKIFSPQLFKKPANSLIHCFDEVLGPVDERRRNTCVVAFEPNYRHAKQLAALQHLYNQQDWRVAVFSGYTVGTANDTKYLEYTNRAVHGKCDPHKNDIQAGGFVVDQPSNASCYDKTNVIDFVEFAHRHVLARTWQPPLTAGGGGGAVRADSGDARMRMVVKMDIEGGEYTLLPALLVSGVACAADRILTEFHAARFGFGCGANNAEPCPPSAAAIVHRRCSVRHAKIHTDPCNSFSCSHH